MSLVVVFMMLVPNMASASSLTEIITEKYYSINITQGGAYKEVLFTPNMSGNYNIFSKGSIDTKIIVFDDSTSEILAENDDVSISDTNFSLDYDFEKGVVYRLRFFCHGAATGTFYVKAFVNSLAGDGGSVNVNPVTSGCSIPFSPSKTGVFRFYSLSADGKAYDTKFTLKNSDGEIVAYDDDHGMDRNFAVSYYMRKGETYILEPAYYYSGDYTTSSYYTLCCETIVANSLSVTKNGIYYVGDNPDTGLTVTARYPSYYEDTFEKTLVKGEYRVSLDTSTSGKDKVLTVSTYAAEASTLVTVKKPTIDVKIDGNYVSTYSMEGQSANAVAETTPNNVDVYWESSDTEVLKVTKTGQKTARIEVNSLTSELITLTAYYVYNGTRYECPFKVRLDVLVDSVTVVEAKKTYIYGETFQPEVLDVVISDPETGRKFTHTIIVEEDASVLKSLTKKVGNNIRKAQYRGVEYSYPYVVRCAAPKIESITSISGSQQNIKWKASPGAKGYYIYRSTSKSKVNSEAAEIGSTTGTSFVSTDLSANKTYYYSVKAYYNSNEKYDSDYSKVSSKKTKLATPKISVKTNSSSQQTITWGKVSGATSYVVYYKTTKDGAFKFLAETKSTSYVNKKLSANKTYYYSVVAKNSSNQSAFATTKSAKTSLATPKISSITVDSSSKLTIKWGKVSGAKNYYVYRATSKDGTYKKIATTTSTTYVNKSLSANTTYYYKIVAVDSERKSAYSSYKSAKTKLSTPQISSVKTNSSSQQTITWGKVSGAKGYHIYSATSKTGSYKKIGSTTSLKFTSTGLKSKQTYYYKIVAYTSKSDSKTNSAASSPVGAKTK